MGRLLAIRIGVLFMILPPGVYAQNSLTGTVVDAISGIGIPGVSIQEIPTGGSGTTASDGTFGMAFGGGQIDFTVSGYEPETRYVFSSASGYMVYMYPAGFDFSYLYSRTSGSYFASDTWSHTGHSGVPSTNGTSGSGLKVFIGNNHSVVATDNVYISGSLTIDAGASLDLNGIPFQIQGDLQLDGTILNLAPLDVSFPMNISSNTIPVLQRINITSASVTLQTDIVLTNGFNESGGTMNMNGFIIYNCLPPKVAPSSPMASSPTGNSLTLNWTPGDGSGVLVVARLASTPPVPPTAGTTYTANSSFGAGATTGPGNYVVYAGSATTVAVSNLSMQTNYTFDFFEYSGGQCYNLRPANVTANSGCATFSPPANPQGDTYCTGDEIPSISVSAPLAPLGVAWYNAAIGGNPPSGADVGGAVNEILYPVGPGTYYAATRDPVSGCESATRTAVVLTENSPINVQSPDVQLCSGDRIDWVVDGTAPFSWTISNNPNIQGASAGSGTAPFNFGIDNNQTLINNSSVPQSITYSFTNPNGCNSSSLIITATVDPMITAFDVSGVQCANATISLSGSQTNVNYQLLQSNASVQSTMAGTGASISFNAITIPDTYTINAVSPAGCSLPMNGSFTTGSVPAIVLSGTPDVCNGMTVNYSASTIGSEMVYNWSIPPGANIVSGAGTPVIMVEFVSVSPGVQQISYSYTNQCGESAPANLGLNVAAGPSGSIVLPDQVNVDEPATFEANTSITNLEWNFGDGGQSTEQTPQYTYLTGGDYEVVLNLFESGCKTRLAAMLTVNGPPQFDASIIKNVVTANADQANDYLTILELDRFPDNEIAVLDRWGVEVFRTSGYTNDWDFRVNGKYLPAGNYVCILKIGRTGQVIKRTVTLVKE